MHLARQKVQMTFFSRKMTFRKEQKNALFVERAILHVVKRNNFFVLFWCIWQGKKYKWRSFLERWHSERNKKNALFVERAILHVVKRNNFFVLFWCIWQGKKYKWRSFLERWPSERNKKNALFVVRAIHVMSFSDAFGKAKSTSEFFSREMTFILLFLWREPFFM